MPVPGASDFGYYRFQAPPDNDDDEVGGTTPDFGTDYYSTQSSLGVLYSDLQITSADQDVFAAAARRADLASSRMDNARIYNRTACQLNSSGGIAQVTSSNAAADVGRQCLFTGKVSGVWRQEVRTMGLSGCTSTYTWDPETCWMFEALNSGGAREAPTGNWAVLVDGEQVGLMYGTGEGASLASSIICALFRMALATAKNTGITMANRRTAPVSGVGSYGRATYWGGADTSLAVPSNTLTNDGSTAEWIAMVIDMFIPANMPAPQDGRIRALPMLLGVPRSYS